MPFQPLATLANWVKDHLSLRYVVILGLVSAFVLWAPHELLTYLNLQEFAVNFRWLAALLLVLSVAVIVTSLLTALSRPLLRMANSIFTDRRLKKYLASMAQDQLMILSQYTSSGKSTLYFQPTQSEVMDLVQKGFLYVPSAANGYYPPKGVGFSLTKVGAKLVTQARIQKIMLEQSRPKYSLMTRLRWKIKSDNSKTQPR